MVKKGMDVSISGLSFKSIYSRVLMQKKKKKITIIILKKF